MIKEVAIKVNAAIDLIVSEKQGIREVKGESDRKVIEKLLDYYEQLPE